MKLHEDQQYTFNDVFIYQGVSLVNSRKECSINPRNSNIKKPLNSTTPYIASNMNAVSGKRMSEAIATYGGLCCLPQDMDFFKKCKILDQLGKTHHNLIAPILIEDGKENVIVAKQLTQKKSIPAVFLEKEGEIVGYYTKEYLNQFQESEKINSQYIPYLKCEVLTNFSKENIQEYYNTMVSENKEFLVFEEFVNGIKRYGVLTKKHAIRLLDYQPTVNTRGELDVIITFGMNQVLNDENVLNELLHFYERYGITQFMIDTAHGGQVGMVEAIKKVKEFAIYNNIDIILIAGNVSTAWTTRLLLDAGADGVKVGIGPGAMCSTRMQTGVGRPQFSAIVQCALEARKTDNWIIADGGIKYTRDVCLALAAGASYVMLGTILAGTLESVSEIKQDMNGRQYKENFGMASGYAVKERSKDESPYDIARKMRYQEGISSSVIYIQEGLSTVGDVLDHFTTGLQSSMTYVGARNLQEFYDFAEIGVQTSQGFVEGTPHGKIVG